MRAYIDSDILIWHLRGEARATEFLRLLSSQPENELWVGAMQRAEIVFFMRKAEAAATLSFLSKFKTHPVTQQIVDAAATLYRKWQPTHGTEINDALLAATAMATGGKIYTLNFKHYPMADVTVFRAWEPSSR